VNGELLARFVGRKVLLVGKAESLEGGVMRMRTSDNRVVSVTLKGGATGYSSDFVEFEAVVLSADSVREEEHTSFGSAFGARPTAATHATPAEGGARAWRLAAHRAQTCRCRYGQLRRLGEAHQRRGAAAILLSIARRLRARTATCNSDSPASLDEPERFSVFPL
jgi:replication factor A3